MAKELLVVKGDKVMFPERLIEARIINRPNRFIVNAEVNGEQVRAHCPTTGRIGGYKLDGLPCLLSGPYNLTKRATEYTIEAFSIVEPGEPDFQWIGINQTAMNSYVHSVMAAGALSEAVPTATPDTIQREKKLGSSRIDFLVNGDTWVEVKMPLTIIQADSRGLEPKEFKPKIGINRMLTQLRDMTAALEAGQKALMISAFAYAMPDRSVPGATSSKRFGPLPEMEAAQRAGLERWQLNFSFHPTHVKLEKFFKLPVGG